MVEEKDVHLPDALNGEHTVLPAQDRGADALVQQPDQRTGHGVVAAPVHDLDGEQVEGPDRPAPLRQVGHPRLQQDHVDNVVQHGGAGALHQVHLHLGLQHVSVLEAAGRPGPDQLNLVVIFHQLVQLAEGGDGDLEVGVVDLGDDGADGLVRLLAPHTTASDHGDIDNDENLFVVGVLGAAGSGVVGGALGSRPRQGCSAAGGSWPAVAMAVTDRF